MLLNRVFAIAVCALCAAACSTASTGGADDAAAIAATRTAVAKRMDDYLAAARADKLDTFADYWTDSARLIEPEIDLSGRTAVMAMIGDVLKSMKLAEMSLKTTDIFVHDRGTVAYQYGSVDETLAPRDGKAAAVRARVNFVVRWVKQADGVWRMDRMIETPMPALPGEAKPK